MTDEMIEYVSILAKLELTTEEKEKAKKDMEKMLSYFDKLNELDTENVEPMTHIFPSENVFREDHAITEKYFTREDILKNAPKQKEGTIQVPKTIS